MLDLKAKLLAAGVVTVDQVKKVEDEQAARQARDAERREAERRRREEGPAQGRSDRGGDRGGDRGPRQDRGDRPQRPHRDGPPRDGAPRGDRPRGDQPRGDQPRGDQSRGDRPQQPRGDRPRGDRPPREPRPVAADGVAVEGAVVDGAEAPKRTGKPRDTRSFKERRAEENLEKRARREHEWNEAMRWRGRIDALKAAGKSEQYEATRGWVMKERLDNKQITEAAQRFFFTTYAGTLSHLTVEPEIHAQLVDGSAGIVAFVGYNGQEHAVVPKDIAVDVRAIKPEWLRHLIGITDLEPPLVKPPVVEAPAEGAEGAEGGGGAEGQAAAAADGADAAVPEAGAEIDDGEGQPEAAPDVASTEPEAG